MLCHSLRCRLAPFCLYVHIWGLILMISPTSQSPGPKTLKSPSVHQTAAVRWILIDISETSLSHPSQSYFNWGNLYLMSMATISFYLVFLCSKLILHTAVRDHPEKTNTLMPFPCAKYAPSTKLIWTPQLEIKVLHKLFSISLFLRHPPCTACSSTFIFPLSFSMPQLLKSLHPGVTSWAS